MGEEVVEVWEHTVELVGVRIPVGEQPELEERAQEARELARVALVDEQEQHRDYGNADALEDHRQRVVHAFVKEQYEHGGQCPVGEADHLDGKQPAACFRTLE